jgi:hypothetical protein
MSVIRKKQRLDFEFSPTKKRPGEKNTVSHEP